MGTREQVEKWASMPEGERQPPTQKELALILGVTQGRVTNLLTKLRKKKALAAENGSYFDIKAKNVDEALVRACEKGNAQALRTYYQLTQRLVEKREDTHKFEFTPTDYTRIARGTINGLRADFESTGGICPICGQPPALRQEPCMDTEPEQSEGGEVATLALPVRPD